MTVMQKEQLLATPLEDFGSWESWLEAIEAQRDLPNESKQAALSGLRLLREAFGEAWLGEAIHARHPFLANLVNEAPWTRWWIGEIGQSIWALRHVLGFKVLLARLKQARECAGAFVELSMASRIQEAGFIVELSPAIHDTARLAEGVKGVAPDIVVPGNPSIYIELTALRASEEWREAHRTLTGLSPLRFGDPEVATGGQINRILSDQQIAEYQRRIPQLIERVRATKTPEQIHDENLDFYIAPVSDKERIARWDQERKVNHLAGPFLRPRALVRLCRALREKVKQIPTDGAGVIILYDNHVQYEAERSSIIDSLTSAIREYPHVAGAALVSERVSVEEPETRVVDYANGMLISRLIDRIFREDLLFVWNPAARFPLSKDLLLRLLSK